MSRIQRWKAIRTGPGAFPLITLSGFLLSGLVVQALAAGGRYLWNVRQDRAAKHAAEVASAFAPFAPRVKTHADDRNFYVESNGMPSHPMMVGIKNWQQQVPIPQDYTGANAWQFPLHPTPAVTPMSGKEHFFRGAMAIAVNGVPIFNALNNRGEDSFKIGELDNYGGHCGRADDYHYHIAPTVLEQTVGKAKPIAYALDGYPLYGYTEPDGSPIGKLDAFNGHSTVALGYHYHATKTYPYLNGGFHGEVREVEGQVDPQPRAHPVRPAAPPLPGAAITEFQQLRPGSYALTYTLDGKAHHVNYTALPGGGYHFDYINANEEVTARDYRGGPVGQANPKGPRRPEGENNSGGQDRPTGPDRQGRPDGSAGGDERHAPGGRGGRGGRDTPYKPEEEIVQPVKGFVLTCPGVDKERMLAVEYTGDGDGISPPLQWSGAPGGTKSFAVIIHHIDPQNLVKVYWTLYDLSAMTVRLEKNLKGVGKMGHNTINNRLGYAPPHSQGPGRKTYIITVYALSEPPQIVDGGAVTRSALLAAMKGHVLGTAELRVNYTRREP